MALLTMMDKQTELNHALNGQGFMRSSQLRATRDNQAIGDRVRPRLRALGREASVLGHLRCPYEEAIDRWTNEGGALSPNCCAR